MWFVVVHDVPGPLAVFRERGVGESQSMSAATRRSSFSETVLALLFQRPEVSPEVSVHFIFFRLSISGKLRTIDSCPEACTCTFVTNLAGQSAIVKRKKKKSTLTSTATDEQRFSLSALSNMHRASNCNSNQDIVHLSSQEKTRKSV